MVVRTQRLTVLGASSPGTHILLRDLGEAFSSGRLTPIEVRLWGRDAGRLGRVAEVAPFPVFASTDIGAALDGADLVLCQVRPGGYAGRSADESLAIQQGIPGDEGLGPSGLSCFLRGMRVMDGLYEAVARFAPGALLLQMTSPLGLQVARAVEVFGLRCVGVCELPTTTAERARAFAEPVLGTLRVDHLGLNHQGWLHRFTDAAGVDRTREVLALLPDDGRFQVDRDRILAEGAIPLPYLRLYYHPERELAAQLARSSTRGEQLQVWADRLEAAPDLASRAAVLAERRMDWYQEGLLPVLEAMQRGGSVPLNLPAGELVEGMPHQAVLELPCALGPEGTQPRVVPPLPPGPDALFRRLVAWERAVLALPAAPGVADLAEVLAAHPMVPDAAVAERLAVGLSALL